MVNSVNNSVNFGCVSSNDCRSSLQKVTSAIVSESSYVAQTVIESMASVGMDCIRAVDYSAQWIGDFSKLSPEVKAQAGEVKHVADRCGLFGSFCEMWMASKDLVTKQAQTVWDRIDIASGFVGSSADFYGRLDELKAISLGAAKPFVGGAGAVADAVGGLGGVRAALLDPEENATIGSTVLKVAKYVSLIVLAVFAGISACVTSVAATWTALPLYILSAATTFLSLKVASNFYDKLVLPMSLEAKMS